jgi:F-type H+-transporting ATPase subunit delta
MPLTFAEPDALARVYARSLFELAQKAGGQPKIEETLAELDDILELARTDARFGEFLASRILTPKARGASLGKIFGGRVSDLTLNFLRVLNAKDRLQHLPPIIAAFDQMVQEEFGRIEVNVYTATAAQPAELDAIRQRLKSVLGKEPVVHAYAEPSMIGGLKLQIGDRLIDASIASSLRKLRDRLNQDGSAGIHAKAERFFN